MHAQPLLPIQRPIPVPLRGLRRPFVPSPPPGPYRLPAPVLERLTAVLAPFKNRDAALALAVMLGRYWTAPARLGRAFPVDRRALAGHAAHDGLTEGRVRGALRLLEAVGFLDREEPPARARYQRTAEGLHRRPLVFRFGIEFAPLFEKANARSRPPQDRRNAARRTLAPSTPSRPPTAPLEPSAHMYPRGSVAVQPSPEVRFLMGQEERGSSGRSLAPPETGSSALESALARLGAAVALTLGANRERDR